MENKKQRNSSIELLRIIAMVGVVILHYNGTGGFKYVNSGSIQERYVFFSESAFICAVNLFVMISAYFLATTEKRKFVKVVELLGQVIIFKIVYYIVTIILGNQSLSFSGVLRNILPNNYFVIFYLIVYTLSPYINVMIKNISKKDFKKLVIAIFLLFSVWATIADLLGVIFGIEGLNTVGLWGDESGYTIVNFILVYFIGAYIRLNNISITKKKAAINTAVCIILIYLEAIAEQIFYSLTFGSNLAWHYNNPIVILLPVFIILFFTKLEFNSKVINELVRATFTCYLIHSYFLQRIGIENFVNGNIFILIIHQFGSAIAIYLVSYIVYKIYNICTKPVIKWITPKCNKFDISIQA